MLDDSRLDGKLQELTRELLTRPVVPGFTIADAFTTQGLDETGKLGLFAAILLGPSPTPELNTLTTFRQVMTARTPAFPIVVQGAPEVLDSTSVVPGGKEYFEQVKLELRARRERMKPRPVPHVAAAPAPVLKAPPAMKLKAAGSVSARTARKSHRRVSSR